MRKGKKERACEREKSEKESKIPIIITKRGGDILKKRRKVKRKEGERVRKELQRKIGSDRERKREKEERRAYDIMSAATQLLHDMASLPH